MESRNVLLAIILSTTVLIFWAVFMEPPVIEQQTEEKQITKSQNETSPSIDEDGKVMDSEITRNEVINNTKRIYVENENIKGSISLEGGIIDDIIFKNYKEKLGGEKNVTFLNPKNSSKEYFIETGWASSGNGKTKLPLLSTIWKIKGNNKLTPNSPITLEWDNGENLIFTRTDVENLKQGQGSILGSIFI